MRSLVFVVRRSLRQLVSVNINLFVRNHNEKELNLIREVDCRKADASLFWYVKIRSHIILKVKKTEIIQDVVSGIINPQYIRKEIIVRE